jgi:hypothetical protein
MERGPAGDKQISRKDPSKNIAWQWQIDYRVRGTI